MYSMEKLARGIIPNKTDPERLEQCRKRMDRQIQEKILQNRGRDVWPSNQYLVNCDEPVDRACGPIYRSKK